MDKVERKRLIKSLLSGRLSKKQRKAFADLESVDIEIKKQWNESGNRAADMAIKEQIWKKVKTKCEYRKNNRVLVEPRWYFAAASIALLLTIGGFWLTFKGDKIANELIKITAQQNQIYTLPDSSKVWMEPGSSIQYTKAFNKERKVWLSGNSLFEVYKHEGSTFQVYIDKAFIEVKGTCFHIKQTDAEKNEITLFRGSGNSLFEVYKHEGSTFQVHINKAFIEVKGTCFLVKQDDIKQNEITLFHGKIEFNVESTGKKIVMQPLQKVTYNVDNAQTQIENISNISWENGRYNFEDVPLTQLIETVNQMYNTNIVLKRNLGKKALFSGSIRYDETLDDVLDKICFSLNLTIETHNEQIIIH
ncbi:uncharacterized protein BN535_02270 [Bacteroides caccae CAG:21]|nr:uncharacterized protein BN535_02270 [Bacteroides caccae CAG:21]